MKLTRMLSMFLIAALLLCAPVYAEPVVTLQTALENAALLTNDSCAYIPGLGVVAVGSNAADEIQSCSVRDIKKMIVSASTFMVLTLTNGGELYFNYEKVADNVVDCVVCTNNIDEEGIYITADGKTVRFHLNSDNNRFVTNVLDENADPINFLAAEKHDYFAVRDNEILFNGNGDTWTDCDFRSWSDVALLDAAKVVVQDSAGNSVVESATVAAITNDGRTLATGTYADEILSWGDLAYLSMNHGIIAGLSTDGTLRLTGEDGKDLLANTPVSVWKNLVAVRVWYGIRGISAVDINGNYYFQPLNGEQTILNSDGLLDGTVDCKLYTPDGYTYEAVSSSPGWTNENGEAPVMSEQPVAAESSASTLPSPLTEDAAEAYIDELTADLESRMSEQRYQISCYINDSGSLNQIHVEVFKMENEVDTELLGEIYHRLINSELFEFTSAGIDSISEFTFKRNNSVSADGWEIQYRDLPMGGMILFFDRI